MQLTSGHKQCANCGQRLPETSKLTYVDISADEAEQQEWKGLENANGTVTINLCMQCQIDRTNRSKHGY